MRSTNKSPTDSVTETRNESGKFGKKLDPSDVKIWTERVRKSANRKRQKNAKWLLMEKMYEGKQWFALNNKFSLVRDRRLWNNNAAILPLIRNVIEYSAATAMAGKTYPQAVPAMPENAESVISADTASRCLRYIDEYLDTPTINIQIMRYLMIFGKMFKCVSWDDEAKGTMRVSNEVMFGTLEENEEIQMIGREKTSEVIEGPIGNVREEIVLPYEMYVPHGIRCLDDAHWIVRVFIKSIDYVRDRYGALKDIESENIRSNRGIVNDGWTSQGGEDVEDGDSSTSDAGRVWLFECWEKQSSGQWRRDVICNEQHINSGEDLHNDHPFIEYDCFDEPAKFWSSGVIEDLEPLQRNINYLVTEMMTGYRNSVKPFVMLPKGPGGTKPSPIDNSWANMWEYHASPYSPAPAKIDLNTIPSDMLDTIDWQIRQMFEAAGLHEASRGATPSGQRISGKGISYLQDKDSTRLARIKDLFDSRERLAHTKKLKLIQRGYTEERLITVIGHNNQALSSEVSGDQLNSVSYVRILQGDIFPQGIMAKWDVGMQLFQMGYFQEQRAPERAAMLGMMGLAQGGFQEIDNYDQYERIRTQIEQNWFLNGDVTLSYVPLDEDNPAAGSKESTSYYGDSLFKKFQNHETHLQEHNKFRNSPAFGAMSVEMQELFNRHVEFEHQEHVSKLQQQQEQKQISMAKQAAEIKRMEKGDPKGNDQPPPPQPKMVPPMAG